MKEGSKIIIDGEKHIVGTNRWIPSRIIGAPLVDANGGIVGTVEAITDLSELRTLAEERDEVARKLSTPLVEVWKGIVMVPLIGRLDSDRAKQLTESILQYIGQSKSEIAILDISGVAAVDTKVANHLLRMIQAVKLMGSEMIITGIRPDVASAIVALGVEMSGIVTRGVLREGLEYAFEKLGVKLSTSQ
jgi:anti-anti-sigma regulatory factor